MSLLNRIKNNKASKAYTEKTQRHNAAYCKIETDTRREYKGFDEYTIQKLVNSAVRDYMSENEIL